MKKNLYLSFLFLFLFAASAAAQCTVTGPVTSITTCLAGTVSLEVTAAGCTTYAYQWYSNTSSSNTGGTKLDTETNSTFSPSTTIAGTFFYYCVVTADCGTATSDPATVIVEPASAGGTIAGSTSVCTGTNNTSLILAGYIGSIKKWQYSTDNWLTASDIFNTTSTLDVTNLTETTKYRAVVQSGSCDPVNSAEATVTVTAASIGGTVSGSVSVCSGTNTATLTLAGYTGSILNWQSSTDNWVSVSEITNNTTTLTITDLTETTKYRAVVKSGACAVENSGPATITVNPILPSGVTISADANPVCSGTTVTFTAIPVNGGISPTYQWYNGAAMVGSGDPTYSYIPANGDIIKVIMTSSASCVSGSPATSDPITMTVNSKPAISAMTFNAGSDSPFTVVPENGINGTVPDGTTYSWGIPVVDLGITLQSDGTNQPSITGTLHNSKSGKKNATYTVTPISAGCTGAVFSLVVSVYPKPVVHNKTVIICSGSTFSILPEDGIDSDVIPLGTTYSWPSPTSPSYISGRTAGSAASTISGTLMNNSNSPGSVIYNVTPKSGTLSGNPFTVTVTVNPSPKLSGISLAAPICSGESGALINLEGLIPSNNSTINYSIDGIPQTAISGVIASATGTAGFTTPVLTESMNGKILRLTSVTNTSNVPNCTSVFAMDASLIVDPMPTFASASAASSICAGNGAIINLGGLLHSSEFTISYMIDGVIQPDITGCTSDPSGNASFTSVPLPSSKNGKILRITGIRNTSGAAGCSISTSKDILLIINTKPIPAISGDVKVCNGSDKVYSILDGMNTYSWDVIGGTITGGDGTKTINVVWNTPGTGKVLVSCSLNGCSSATIEQNVSVSAIPEPVISGATSVCINSAKTYSTEAGMSGYTWTVTGGTIVPPVDGNVVVVNWTSSGTQTINVNYLNPSGCPGSSPAYSVTVNPLPVITVNGPDSPRVTSSSGFTTEAGMTGYNWGVTGGGIWIATGNTNQITWNTIGSKTVSVNYIDSHGCTAASPAEKTVNVSSLPSVAGVSVSGYPGIGETLTGLYTYTDGSSGSEIPTYKWLRNGIDPVSTDLTYVPVSADKDKTLTFEVTPASTVGPPFTNSPVKSSPTAPVEEMTGLPVAEFVCIEGVRASGNTIRGKYFYNYSKAEGASIYKWFKKDTVSGVTDIVGNNIEYTLTDDDLGDRKEIFFEVTPVSTNLVPRTGIAVRSKPLAKILGLKDLYSVVEPAVKILTNIKGGVFSGPGVSEGKFAPVSAGAGGPYSISYFINHVNIHHICSQQATREVKVNPNVAYFTGFDNVYCHDGPPDVITASHVPAGSINLIFEATNMSAIISQSDSVVTIKPANMRAGSGRDTLIFSYEKTGLKYVIKQPFVIDSVGTDLKLVNLDSAYCRTTDKHFISVNGIYPSGGTADWTSSVLTSKNVSSAYVDPMLGTAGIKYVIRYRYQSVNGCYSKLLKHYVKIQPLPDPDFDLDPSYNVDGGAVTLNSRTSGGIFTGEGVAGNKFFPDIAGLNDHTIRYTVTNSNNCTASAEKTTNVRNALGAITGINSGICYSNTTYHINVVSLPTTGVLSITGFTNKKGTLVYTPGTRIADYSVTAAGEGADTLVFSYTWDGVLYRIVKPLYIDKLEQVVIYNLSPGSLICDDTTAFKLNASIFGGVFSGPVDVNNKFVPSLASRHDTVKYVYTSPKTGCNTSVKVPVTVFPAPKVSFKPLDVCIENERDTIMFKNNTVSIDAVQAWKWDFYDEGVPFPDKRKEAGYLYLKTGLQRVALTAKTVNGCSVTRDSTLNIGRKPKADFYVKDDCMHSGGTMKLVDTTILNAPVISRSWRRAGVEFSTAAKTALYPKTDSGFVSIQYIVRTNYPDCIDTVTRKVYIRPTITIPATGYSENFDFGKKGWIKAQTSDSIWSFGTPDGSVINGAYSGSNAWYTSKTPKGAAAIESPCFNFISSQRPLIEMKLWRMFERDRDGVALQYKIGDSKQWHYVGTINDGIEWYNSAVIRGEPGGNQLGWTTIGNYDTKWKAAIHTLDELAGKSDVKFRIVYGSEGSYTSHDGFAFDNIWIGERNRNVLVEHFTNITSVAGSSADALVNKIATDKKDDIINIQYHTNFPGADPFYENNPGDASARILFYGLTRSPYTFIDGGFSKGEFAGIFDNSLAPIDSNEITRRSLIPSPFIISLEPDVFGGVLTVKGQITAVDTVNYENLTLFLVVTEKVNRNKFTGALGESEFNNVFRKFIPDAGGIELKTTWLKNETFTIPEKTWAIQSILHASDIEIIAFLQNTATKQIYQTSSTVEPNVIVGLENPPSGIGEFSLYPNPANERITINFSEPLQKDADIKIYDIRGIVVRTYRTGIGISAYTIENPGLRGGIYMIRVSVGIYKTNYKKLIITED